MFTWKKCALDRVGVITWSLLLDIIFWLFQTDFLVIPKKSGKNNPNF